ncbi:Hypothetical predicted protein, partial [Mytilus galloprovincialis]
VCYNTGLTVANGRLGSDTNGKFTFCNSKGTSVNDYLLLSPNNYGIISDFEVLEMNEFSDHMPLFFELNFSTICQKRTNTTTRNYIKWETSKNDEYAQMLQPHREKLLSVVNDITLDVDIHNA